MKFVPYDKTAEILQPSKEPLTLPAAAVTPQRAAILRFAPLLPVQGQSFLFPISIPHSSPSLASSLSLS
jgi:hypothetical protein